jgi:hypothetical protein
MRVLIAVAAILVIGLQILLRTLRHLAGLADTNPRWLGLTSFAALGGALVLVWFVMTGAQS